jgi:hypothetical protein
MNELKGVRKKLRQSLGQDLPDPIWCHRRVQRAAADYLNASSVEKREENWSVLEDEAGERLATWNVAWNEGRKEGLRGVRSGTTGGSQDMLEAASRDSGGAKGIDSGWFVSDRTTAMVGAMAALFAFIGDQIPEVKEFRERILPGRYLTADEAHALIASYAARTFSPSWFEEWGIPFVGHRAEVLDRGSCGEDFSPVDDWMTIRADPPGVDKTVRYAYPRQGDPNTRCVIQNGAVIPIHTQLPSESHGDHVYPSWLWPGSVVDELYDLSVELASAFDWPLESSNLRDTRPWSRTSAWFILTGEAPPVHPIEARWEIKHGSSLLNPQWRIRLTIPPWLPEEEALLAFRLLRRARPKGLKLPKEVRTLEVARFVWEQERLDGYREPPPWKAWCERWNEENLGHSFKSPSNFRTTFLRGAAAVKGLNFGRPEPIDAAAEHRKSKLRDLERSWTTLALNYARQIGGEIVNNP